MTALPVISGVYKIICVKTGKFYVGSAKDIRHRQIQHLCHLRKGDHHCIYLQRAWNKYGEDNFVFEVHKACDNYQEEEKLVLDLLFDTGQLLNTSKQVSGGDLLSYHPNRDEIIARRSQSFHETLVTMSEEERKEKWGRSGPDNGMFGQHHSNESRKQMSEKRKGQVSTFLGRTHSAEAKQKLSERAKLRTGEKNSFYGKTHSDETKAKIREKRLGKKPGNIQYYKIDDQYFGGLYEASKYLGVHVTVVSYRVNSKNKRFDAYSVVSKEEYLANKESWATGLAT